jgi:hypothetical protein
MHSLFFYFVLRQHLYYVARAGLEFLILCFSPLSAGFIRRYHHTWLRLLHSVTKGQLHDWQSMGFG